MTYRKTGAKVLAFLDEHRLLATPEHYAFAYRYLFGDDATLKTSVAAIIDGGVRIKPHQIEKLAQPARLPSAANDTIAPHLDHIAATILGIIGTAAHEAGAFGKELTLAAVELVETDAARVHQVVARMIAQADRAEAGLADMSRRIAVLRDEILLATNNPKSLQSREFVEANLRKALAALPSRLCFAVVTVDQFEAIERDHGPGVADRVVRVVAETVQAGCGEYRVGRWAVGSLAIVFDGISAGTATELLGNARSALAARNLKTREHDRPLGTVTYSAGVVQTGSNDAKSLMDKASTLARDASLSGGNITQSGLSL